jgi:hypothetical protein
MRTQTKILNLMGLGFMAQPSQAYYRTFSSSSGPIVTYQENSQISEIKQN